jgi:hypothetical protein
MMPILWVGFAVCELRDVVSCFGFTLSLRNRFSCVILHATVGMVLGSTEANSYPCRFCTQCCL